jgi:hypothetical protein
MTAATTAAFAARRLLAAGAFAALLVGAAAAVPPASAAGPCPSMNPDPDGDGLTCHEEAVIYSTDPLVFDTDGDNMNDGLEIYYGSDPLVPQYNPAPASGVQNAPDYDYDGDGLGAYDEQTWGTEVTLADSDGDGLNDGDEVFSSGAAPTRWDTDGDGASDGKELAVGMDPLIANPFGP